MKRLKMILLGLAIISGGAVMAQEKNNTKELKLNGDLIEGIFYFDNGQIAQRGHYKDGKLHGEWIAYDQEGNKIAIGKYANGVKVDKWFFWNKGELSEVDYEENRIASVNKWKVDEGLVSK
jgi:antitoxin component YwqK of YwqJK toxin-antitoxin module